MERLLSHFHRAATHQPRRQSPRPRAMPPLDQPCPSNRSRPRLSSELPDSIVEPQSRTSLRSSQDDGVGRARVCVNCRVYEPFQNITDICCQTLHGSRCVFRDADANNDEADPDSDSEDSGPIELEEVPLSPRTQGKLSTHVAQVLSNVMKNRGKSPDAQVEPQSHTGHCSSATAKAPVTAVALRAFPDRIAEFCTPSNEDRSSGKGRPMANADFERRVKARIEEVAALRFGPPSSIDGDRPQYTESQIRYQAMPTGGRRDSSGWRAETDTRAAAAAGVRDYEELCRALAGDRDSDEDQLCGGGCSGGGGNGEASESQDAGATKHDEKEGHGDQLAEPSEIVR